MSPLPGFVPTSNSIEAPLATKPQAREGKSEALRADFSRELETRLSGWLGRPGTERYENLKPMVQPYLRQDTSDLEALSLDLDKLPKESRDDLTKLQHAAEGIEAIFVKKLLAQMRNTTFSQKSTGPMADFAKDMMDQTLAEQASKGKASIGIAKMIFLDTAQPLVRAAIAKTQAEKKGNNP